MKKSNVFEAISVLNPFLKPLFSLEKHLSVLLRTERWVERLQEAHFPE